MFSFYWRPHNDSFLPQVSDTYVSGMLYFSTLNLITGGWD
jgi:hypothetical protein